MKNKLNHAFVALLSLAVIAAATPAETQNRRRPSRPAPAPTKAPAPAKTKATPKAKTINARTGGALDKRLAGKRIRKRGTISSLNSHRVTVGGKSRTVGELSREVFREQDAFSAELKRGRSALLGDPVESSEAIELDNATVLVKSTTAIVVDVAKLERSSATFKNQRGKRGRSQPPQVSELSGESAAEFAVFKTELALEPATHPLRVAMAQGDAALLKAISEGKGELTVTTEVVLPKLPLEVKNGEIQLPSLGSAGLDYTKKRRKKLGFSTDAGSDSVEEDEPAPTDIKSKGEINFTGKFLTGKTIGDSFEWSRTWKFPSGHFRLSAGAYYGFGLRAPVEFTGTITPKKWLITAAADREKKFTVAMSAQTLDASAAYYRRTGLAEGKVFEGKELVIEAGFHIGYNLKAGWGALKKSGSIGQDFDFGKNFKPPFGNCGNTCGFDAWIPSELTRTQLKIGTNKIFVKGAMQLGFHVGGKGTLRVHYESLFGNDSVKSTLDGKVKKQHNIELSGPSTKRIQTQLAPMSRQGTKKYGIRVWDPSYKWKVKVTPGVKTSIQVRAGNWINKTYTVGPLWLDSLAIDLGMVTLPHHKGTKKGYRNKNGEKTFTKN